MKKCPYCGKEYPDEASVCVVDGQALKPVPAAPYVPPVFPVTDHQQVVDSEHIKLLAIFHFVVAGLSLIGIGFLFLHFAFMSLIFSHPGIFNSSHNANSPPKELFAVLIWFYAFFGFILVTAAAFNFLSGMFLRQRRHRVFSLVVGGLNCLQVPFGTILGVFTIIVLSRDSVRSVYGE